MASINVDAVQKLEETASREAYLDGAEILLKLLGNVIREPDNDKYRTIRLENKIIKERLLCLVGVRDLLDEIGFKENDGQLCLTTNVLIARLRKYRDLLSERLENVKGRISSAGPSNEVKKPNGVCLRSRQLATTENTVIVCLFQNQRRQRELSQRPRK